MSDQQITIPLDEYHSLLNDSHILACLEDAGVDNWEGYGEAMKLVRKGEEDDDSTWEEDEAAVKEISPPDLRQPAAVDSGAPAQ